MLSPNNLFRRGIRRERYLEINPAKLARARLDGGWTFVHVANSNFRCRGNPGRGSRFREFNSRLL